MRQAHHQRGFVLVERLLVAGVVAAGVVAVIAWSLTTSSKAHAREYASATVALVQAIETGMGASQSYHGLTTGEALDRGFVPAELTVNGQVDTAWGTLSLGPAGVRKDGIEVGYSRVPERECADYVNAMAPGMTEIHVNGQRVVQAGQVDIPALGAACQGGGSVELIRHEPGYGLRAVWETW